MAQRISRRGRSAAVQWRGPSASPSRGRPRLLYARNSYLFLPSFPFNPPDRFTRARACRCCSVGRCRRRFSPRTLAGRRHTVFDRRHRRYVSASRPPQSSARAHIHTSPLPCPPCFRFEFVVFFKFLRYYRILLKPSRRRFRTSDFSPRPAYAYSGTNRANRQRPPPSPSYAQSDFPETPVVQIAVTAGVCCS